MLGLRLMLPLLLLLHMHPENVKAISAAGPINQLPERCKYLKESKELMHQKCKGKFPSVAHTKYRDTYMTKSDHMALFLSHSSAHIMVALKESELHKCKSIQLIQINEYICYDNNGVNRTVQLKSVTMYCFPFHMQMTDDLMHECILERDGNADSSLELDIQATKGSIIHYTFDNNPGHRSISSDLLVKVLALSMVHIVVYHFHY